MQSSSQNAQSAHGGGIVVWRVEILWGAMLLMRACFIGVLLFMMVRDFSSILPIAVRFSEECLGQSVKLWQPCLHSMSNYPAFRAAVC